jgi:hypothetical protein
MLYIKAGIRNNEKGVNGMAKKRKRNNALPKADEEFAEERGNGLEKVALKAMKRQQNK